jgi:hypothetical protein
MTANHAPSYGCDEQKLGEQKQVSQWQNDQEA